MNVMELRELIALFRREARAFWTAVLICLILGFLFYRLQPVAYEAELLLNVARVGSQQTADYKYDGFYRLQADERFADTLVRWLSAPRVVEDIFAEAGTDRAQARPFLLRGTFVAERLSSQAVRVRYRTESRPAAVRLSDALVRVLNRETASLNQGTKDDTWFAVSAGDPVVADGRTALGPVLVLSLLIGLFVGVWTVLIRHYWKEPAR